MAVPPDTGFDFLLALIWVGWSFSVLAASRTWKSSFSGRLLSLTVVGSLIVGLGLLTFSLVRWGFLSGLLGIDRPVFLRGLPAIRIELMGLLVFLYILNAAVLRE